MSEQMGLPRLRWTSEQDRLLDEQHGLFAATERMSTETEIKAFSGETVPVPVDLLVMIVNQLDEILTARESRPARDFLRKYGLKEDGLDVFFADPGTSASDPSDPGTP